MKRNLLGIAMMAPCGILLTWACIVHIEARIIIGTMAAVVIAVCGLAVLCSSPRKDRR